MITHARLLEVLNYNPLTGIFTRKISNSNCVKVGDVVGRNNGNGYLRTQIDKRSYYMHVLAWFYVTGEWPEHEIDHDDGCGMNNIFTNLRPATHSENHQNLALRSTNKSGRHGVSWNKMTGKWESSIWLNNKKILIGYYIDVEEAGKAYLSVKTSVHNFQPTPRDLRY